MKRLLIAFAVLFSATCHAGSSLSPDTQESLRQAAHAAVHILKERGIQGLSQAVKDCYADPRMKGELLLFCAGMDVSGNWIDASMSAASGWKRTAFFQPDPTAFRLKDHLSNYGFSDADAISWTHEASAYIRPMVNRELSGDSVISNKIAISSLNLFDTHAYCRKIGDAVGGSSEIELTCRRSESMAKQNIQDHRPIDRVFDYCKNIGANVGGSYEIMQTCIQQEESAQRQLGNN